MTTFIMHSPFTTDPSPRRTLARRLRGPLAVLVLCLLALISGAQRAAAHDQLVSSAPSDGERLAATPSSVSVSFSAALLDLGYEVRVVDAASKNWAEGRPVLARETITQPLSAGLPEGEYQVRWRVVSSDGHPINGSYTFLVGAKAQAGTIPVPEDAASAAPDSPSADGAAAESVAAPVPGWLIAAGAGGLLGLGLYLAVSVARRLRRNA
ncbi:copper resistance protein CopC [Arthrobacter sp. NPDC090010]|uniref:copper resistance CopC family protein n=1 Tax=Arthrobacter sp. NPDC090010 TaxID=3363942 RepID=UPI0037F7F9BA